MLGMSVTRQQSSAGSWDRTQTAHGKPEKPHIYALMTNLLSTGWRGKVAVVVAAAPVARVPASSAGTGL